MQFAKLSVYIYNTGFCQINLWEYIAESIDITVFIVFDNSDDDNSDDDNSDDDNSDDDNSDDDNYDDDNCDDDNCDDDNYDDDNNC